MHNMETDVILD